MKILVTGGAGYIGSLLTHVLISETLEVTSQDPYARKLKSLEGCCYSKYLTILDRELNDFDFQKLKDFDVVIHLAAIVGAKNCEQDKLLTTKINIDLTERLIAKKQKDQVFIYTNTNSGYGSEGICTEETPLSPSSHYGKTKVEAEKCWLEKGGISLRFASLFGPSPKMRHDLLLNFLVREAFFKKKIELYESGYRRNFLYVGDAVRAIGHAIANLKQGEAYNVGTDDANLTKKDLSAQIKKHLPETEIVEIKTEEKDPDQRDYIVSNEKIRNTHFKTWTGIDDGIKQLIKYYDYIGRENC